MTAARSEDSNPRSSDATVVRPLGRSRNLAVSPVSGDLCPSRLGSVLRFGPSNRLSLANHPGARRRTQCDEHTPIFRVNPRPSAGSNGSFREFDFAWAIWESGLTTRTLVRESSDPKIAHDGMRKRHRRPSRDVVRASWAAR